LLAGHDCVSRTIWACQFQESGVGHAGEECQAPRGEGAPAISGTSSDLDLALKLMFLASAHPSRHRRICYAAQGIFHAHGIMLCMHAGLMAGPGLELST